MSVVNAVDRPLYPLFPPQASPLSFCNETAESQSAILRLVPDLDNLRWVLIAVALIGIAVAIHTRIDA